MQRRAGDQADVGVRVRVCVCIADVCARVCLGASCCCDRRRIDAGTCTSEAYLAFALAWISTQETHVRSSALRSCMQLCVRARAAGLGAVV
jgi:hypothetical protein